VNPIPFSQVMAVARPVRPVMKNEHLKREAYTAVARARRNGGLVPGPCAVAGCTSTPTVAHHEDYALSLDVTWLCRHHHAWRHMGDLDERFQNVWWELEVEKRILRSLRRALSEVAA
jgi:hypothetical protein